jgi:hypothetical protein
MRITVTLDLTIWTKRGTRQFVTDYFALLPPTSNDEGGAGGNVLASDVRAAFASAWLLLRADTGLR